MKTAEQITEQLNKCYPTSRITRFAIAGEWASASNEAASCAMWGIWPALRDLAGLPSDIAAKKQLLAEFKAARMARYANAR
jgi:hypothetical protein